jgi:hypothetical protein
MFSKQARQHAARHCCASKESSDDKEVKLIPGNDRVNQLAQRPEVAEGVGRIRAEMAKANRTYAMRPRRAPARRRTYPGRAR